MILEMVAIVFIYLLMGKSKTKVKIKVKQKLPLTQYRHLEDIVYSFVAVIPEKET